MLFHFSHIWLDCSRIYFATIADGSTGVSTKKTTVEADNGEKKKEKKRGKTKEGEEKEFTEEELAMNALPRIMDLKKDDSNIEEIYALWKKIKGLPGISESDKEKARSMYIQKVNQLVREASKDISGFNLKSIEDYLALMSLDRDIPEEDIKKMNRIVSAIKTFQLKSKYIVEQAKQLGTRFPLSAQAVYTEVIALKTAMQSIYEIVPPEIKIILEKKVSELIVVAKMAEGLSTAFNNIHTIFDSYIIRKSINNKQFLEQWKKVKQNMNITYALANEYHLPPEYKEIPFFAMNVLTENNENIAALGPLSYMVQMITKMEELETNIPDTKTLEEKMKKDLLLDNFCIKSGAKIIMGKKRFEVRAVRENAIVMYPNTELSPAELYLELLLKSHPNLIKDTFFNINDKKVEAEFVPRWKV